MDSPTPEQIAQHYKAMGDSVWLINAVIAGDQMVVDTQDAKKDCVSRNVQHLKIMLAKDFWANEDMSAINQAIADGQTFLGAPG
jgi:hypothetical protein